MLSPLLRPLFREDKPVSSDLSPPEASDFIPAAASGGQKSNDPAEVVIATCLPDGVQLFERKDTVAGLRPGLLQSPGRISVEPTGRDGPLEQGGECGQSVPA